MPHPIVSYATTAIGMARAAVPRKWTSPVISEARWSPQKAQAWGADRGWMMGCNFVPSTAGNQLEMWQKETFDPSTIERELGWAAALGMNSIRVFLHDLVWAADCDAYLDRVDVFLRVADHNGISTVLVLFDGVWNPEPQLGPQGDPTPRVHNSMWVQGPGAAVLGDRSLWPRLRPYVEAVVTRFAHDPRVVVWDLFNEPDQTNAISYPRREVSGKARLANDLLNQIFDWCCAVDPDQPLTAGVFVGVNGSVERTGRLNRTMLSRSDVISFHSYSPRAKLLSTIEHLRRYRRPILCTEWMARTVGSRVQLVDVLAEQQVSAWSWGLVDGRSQTKYPWTTWLRRPKEDSRPKDDKGIWFHDLLHRDGRPFDAAEAESLRAAARRMRSAEDDLS